MKVKLLKKVRKRFQIIHMPKGYVGVVGEHYNLNLFKLTDQNNTWNVEYTQLINKKSDTYYRNAFYTEQECISYLKTEIIRILRYEGYRQKKDRVIKKSQKKIWYK